MQVSLIGVQRAEYHLLNDVCRQYPNYLLLNIGKLFSGRDIQNAGSLTW